MAHQDSPSAVKPCVSLSYSFEALFNRLLIYALAIIIQTPNICRVPESLLSACKHTTSFDQLIRVN